MALKALAALKGPRARGASGCFRKVDVRTERAREEGR
jgi:hypothetical protein